MPADVHDQFLAIVLGGTRRAHGMPGFAEGAGFPLIKTRMSVSDALALHAYLIDLQWKAFRSESKP